MQSTQYCTELSLYNDPETNDSNIHTYSHVVTNGILLCFQLLSLAYVILHLLYCCPINTFLCILVTFLEAMYWFIQMMQIGNSWDILFFFFYCASSHANAIPDCSLAFLS